MEVFNLDMRPGKASPVIHCSQFDEGRAFRANLFDGTAVYTLDGTETLTIIEKKLDGNEVTIGVTNTSDSYVDFDTTQQMTALAGPQLCELRIEKGAILIGSANFILDCEESPDTGIASDSAIHNLEEQIAEAVADQYDAADVVFDAVPTAGHGVGFAVTSEGVKNAIPDELDDLSDVTYTGTPAMGEAVVWDGSKWTNGTVSTVGSIDDLNDVDTTGKAEGDSLRYDSNDGEWKAKPTTVAMTSAEWGAIPDQTAWKNAHTNTHLVITDAPNLNATAQDLSYDGGVTSTYDEVESIKDTALQMATFDFTKSINATTQAVYYILRSDFNLPTGAKVKSCFLRENTYNTVNAGGLVYSARANETATNAIDGAIYNGTNTNRIYNITATVFYTLT